jgi:hypothetical protein
MVTPHIVHPTRPNAVAHSPLDSTLPANDIDFFLNGQPEGLAVGALNRPYVGHVLDLLFRTTGWSGQIDRKLKTS